MCFGNRHKGGVVARAIIAVYESGEPQESEEGMGFLF